MVQFCGYVQGFHDPAQVAALSYDHSTREFESFLRSSRQHLQNQTRLVGVLEKALRFESHVPCSSLDRRFLEQRAAMPRYERVIAKLSEQARCRVFDRNVIPFAFAFARERARANKLGTAPSDADMHAAARLSRLMARDWLEETGRVVKNQLEARVMEDLARVHQWLSREHAAAGGELVGTDLAGANAAAWQQACLAPILALEPQNAPSAPTPSGEVVCAAAPEYSGIPNDAVWTLAIHPGGVRAWLRSLARTGYVSVQSQPAAAAEAGASGEAETVPAPLTISHASLSQTLSQLPQFLLHTDQRTLRVTRAGARASKEAAAIRAAAKANLEEEQRLLNGEDDEEDVAAISTIVQRDLQQVRPSLGAVPAQLAGVFQQAIATPFLSTSASAAKKRKKWLLDAVQSNQVGVRTFAATHLAEAAPAQLPDVLASNRQLKRLPASVRAVPVPSPSAGGDAHPIFKLIQQQASSAAPVYDVSAPEPAT